MHPPLPSAPLPRRVDATNFLAEMAAALAPVVPQVPHPYLDTTAGMTAVQQVAREAGGTEVTHVRTAEYVAASFRHDGRKVLARAGVRSVAQWHAEEVRIAAAWAEHGAQVVAPLVPDLRLTEHAAVSLWPWVEHRDGSEADPAEAGRVLREMHDVGLEMVRAGVFDDRPFRAPAKVARRLMAIAETAAAEQRVSLLRAASAVAHLTFETKLDSVATAVHGDFQPGNWLTTPTGPVVVDFATSCRGPAWWDLTLLEGRCGPGREFPRGYWEDFCRGYGVTSTVLDGTPTQLLRTLATAVVGVRRRPDDPERWARLDAAAAFGC